MNNTLFRLEPDLNSVFSPNNSESILQWQLNTSYLPYNSTTEGLGILPADITDEPPHYYLSPQLLNSFEIGDQRKEAWIDSTTFIGTTYHYPYKYKIGQHQEKVKGTATEFYTVFRLSEQYLIRAEARAMQNNLDGSVSDLNVIRYRSGLPNATAITKSDILTAILHERQVELFAEWGHRWLDLKRTGQVDSVMFLVTPEKNPGGAWQSYQQLYPIPQSEITKNPYLTQNEGY